MDPGQMNIDLTYTFTYCFEVDIRVRRHTNKRGIKQNTNSHIRFEQIHILGGTSPQTVPSVMNLGSPCVSILS